MYVLDPAKKEDPVVRWNLPDRIFFGHGACHILAGVFLLDRINPSFEPIWIKPRDLPGMHVLVSDGQIAFDYHGYSVQARLEAHHRKVWARQYPAWTAQVVPVEFDLLDTTELNKRNMRGPDQYLGDAVCRARDFLRRIDHETASRKVGNLL